MSESARHVGAVAIVATLAIGGAVLIATRSCAATPDEEFARSKSSPPASSSSDAAVASEPAAPRREAVESSAPPSPTPKIGKPLLLHVVDAVGRFELRDVTVRGSASHGFFGDPPRIPEFVDGVVLAHGDAPLDVVPKLYGTQPLVVEAVGYAPARLDADWTRGGEREVVLKPAGRLELVVRGRPDRADASWTACEVDVARRRLERSIVGFRETEAQKRRWGALSWAGRCERARARLAQPIATGPTTDAELVAAFKQWSTAPRSGTLSRGDTTTIDGLEPGRHGVLVRVWSREGAPVVAAGVVEIAAGATSRLELDWNDVAPSAPVHVKARVVVDRDWLARGSLPSKCSLRVSYSESGGEPAAVTRLREPGLSTTPDADGGATFDLGSLPPGTYVATLSEWKFDTYFLVAPSPEEQTVEFHVAPPAEVDLTLVDVDTSEPIVRGRARSFTFYWNDSEADAVLADPDGHVRFLAPIGPISLAIDAIDTLRGNYGRTFERFEVVAGRNERTIALSAPATLQVTLVDGNAAVPWNFSNRLVVEKAGVNYPTINGSGGSHSPTYTCSIGAHGRCRVSVRDVDGYDDSDPIEVELATDKTNVVEVPLRRAR